MTSGTWAPPSPEQVELNIRLLRHLYGADLVDPIVQVVLKPEQVVFLERLGLREHQDAQVWMSFGLGGLAFEAEAALLEATVPGGILDPGEVGGDVVGVLIVREIAVTDPTRASKLARRWFVHLTRLAWDADELEVVHPLVFAVAGYSVAFVEHARGRHYQVRRWLQEGAVHVEHEEPPELAILAHMRACRLWVGVPGKG